MNKDTKGNGIKRNDIKKVKKKENFTTKTEQNEDKEIIVLFLDVVFNLMCSRTSTS